MLAALALGWPLLLMRALFAMTMGLITFPDPGWSPYALLAASASWSPRRNDITR